MSDDDSAASAASGDPRVVVEHCPARAALAGNPSDGYGGAVLAVPVCGAAATCTISRSDRYELHADGAAPVVVDRWAELARRSDDVTPDDSHALVLAAIATASGLTGPVPPVRIRTRTTIPRSVGLGGSSAIVIATIRAMLRVAGHEPLHPDEVAVHALRAEVARLGFRAGLQDRVVQAHARAMMMRFGPQHGRTLAGEDSGTYEPVDGTDGLRLVVAHRPEAAEPSGTAHAALRQLFDDGDVAVIRAMTALATEAEHALAALDAGDLAALGTAIDTTFDLRRSMIDLDPRHVEMIETARRNGGHANYTGSGGAVVVLCPDDDVELNVRAALAAIGCRFVPRQSSG